MKPSVAFEFWQIEVTNATLKAVIKALLSLPSGRKRCIDWGVSNEHALRLHEIAPNPTRKGLLEGDMVLLRKTMIPELGNRDGARYDIEVPDDDDVLEATAFIIEKATGRLCIQRNRFAVTKNAFAAYLQEFVPKSVVELKPVLSEGAFERLAKMQRIDRVEIKLGGPGVAPDGFGLKEFQEMKEYFEAPTIEIAIARGRQRGEVKPSLIRKTAKAFQQYIDRVGGENQVRKFSVVGRVEEDGVAERLDLILDQMVVRIEGGDARRAPYELRRKWVRQAWTQAENRLEAAAER